MAGLEYRVDRGGTLAAPRRTPQGYLRVDSHPARCGVLEYTDASMPGGIRRELRLPEDVHSAESLASFADAPVTVDHPPEMLTPANTRAHEVGNVAGQARADGERIAATLVIKDAKAIARVEGGARELSVGYKLRVEDKPGVHPLYGRYDAIQRDIVVNHVAIVDAGRAGSACSIRMDADTICRFGEPRYNSGATMAKPTDQTADLAAAAALVATEKARADKAEETAIAEAKRADAATGRADAAEAECVTLRAQRVDSDVLASKDAEIAKEKTRADAAVAELATFQSRVDAAVAFRTEIERKGRTVLGLEHRFDGLSDRDVMVEVVTKIQGANPIPADVSPEYVKARFDAAYDGHVACGEALSRIGRVADEQRRADAAAARPRTAEEARRAMLERNRNASTTAR